MNELDAVISTWLISDCKMNLKMYFTEPMFSVRDLNQSQKQMIVLLYLMNVLMAANDMLIFVLNRLLADWI